MVLLAPIGVPGHSAACVFVRGGNVKASTDGPPRTPAAGRKAARSNGLLFATRLRQLNTPPLPSPAPGRRGGLPPHPPGVAGPGPHADRQGWGAGTGRRARIGGGRLRDQTVQPAGTRGPGPRDPPPHHAGGPAAGGQAGRGRRAGPRRDHPRSTVERPADRPDGQGVRPPQAPVEPPEPRLHPGLPPRAYLGIRLLRQHADGRHAHQPAPGEDRGRSQHPHLRHDRARGRLQTQEGPGMNRSLRWKLTASYLLLVLFSLAVAAVVLIPAIAQVYSNDYQRDVLNQAKTMARLLETYQADGASIARLDDIANRSSWREGVYVG